MDRDIFGDVERCEVGGRRNAARNLILLPIGRIAPHPTGLRRNPDAAPQSAYGESLASCEPCADDVARDVYDPSGAGPQVESRRAFTGDACNENVERPIAQRRD